MNDLQIFNNEEFGTVRGFEINGEPWFVGKDVAELLGYSDTSDALKRHVDEEDKGVCEIPTPGGLQKCISINESGMYSLILRSNRPEAKRIQRWVTSEVLPTLRKTGSYSLQKPDSYMIEDPAERARRWAEEYEEKKALESQVVIKDQQIALMQPKANYCDVVLNTPDLISVTSIAKDYGWSAQKLNGFLHSAGIQYYKDKRWHLYQQYADKGYTDSKTVVFPGKDGTIHSTGHTYWTQKGRLFIYEQLKACGIVPVSEQPKQLSLPIYDFGEVWS